MGNWLDIVWRSLLAIVILFVLTRILGKKQISQLTLFEYVLGITLGELAGFISTDMEAHFFHGVLALLIWFTVPFLLEYVSMRNRKLRNILEGTMTEVIRDGKILEKNLRKERFSADELMEELRKKDVFDVNEVEYAVLEASGDLNVLLKKENRPLTAKLLNISLPMEKKPESQVVVMDGKLIPEALRRSEKSERWLSKELEKRKLTLEEVYLAQVDSDGMLYLDLYDDSRVLPAAADQTLLATLLRKCQADLELYTLTAKTDMERQGYQRCSHDLSQVLQELAPLMKKLEPAQKG
ncbi:DUF421 domain-containing protein [Gorillibacterium timonense]|uniref:DUF421 domain-containing protein n=1 Tax=Gorillibacterium timonense TaxID=1689269 RepID=UPI00071C45D4|nr:DUF421 domain-containing protein [Gorillibacterium timonense]